MSWTNEHDNWVEQHERRLDAEIAAREQQEADNAKFNAACRERGDSYTARFGPLIAQRLREMVQHLIDIESPKFVPREPEKMSLFDRLRGKEPLWPEPVILPMDVLPDAPLDPAKLQQRLKDQQFFDTYAPTVLPANHGPMQLQLAGYWFGRASQPGEKLLLRSAQFDYGREEKLCPLRVYFYGGPFQREGQEGYHCDYIFHVPPRGTNTIPAEEFTDDWLRDQLLKAAHYATTGRWE